MRYTIFKRGGYNQGVIGTTGGEVAGKVILSRNPIGANEASTKNYVDVKFNTLPVSGFTSGIINAGRVPEFAGDIVKLEGNANTTVKTTTVSAGMYPKVTVNIKGQITGGAILVEGDIPVLPWSKIATGKPTTIGGYGISDCLSTSGGVITGSLKVSEVTSDAKCLVNKSYMDSYATGGAGVSVGGIVYRNSPITPVGFLRCNGGEVNKTTYSALYTVIGDQYGSTHQLGNGAPWRRQYQINNTQSLQLGSWTTANEPIVETYNSKVVVTKNRVFMLGGHLASGETTNTVQTAIINPDGTIGSWTLADPLPDEIVLFTPVVVSNRLYIIGGSKFAGFTTIKDIYYAPITTDGSLGAWVKHSVELPKGLHQTEVFFTRDRIYCLGGFNSTEGIVNNVYTAIIDSSGSIGPFSSAPNLPIPLDRVEVAVIKNYVYIIGGGIDGFNGSDKIYRAPIALDGTIGTWIQVGTTPEARASFRLIATKYRLYYIGGSSFSLQPRISSKVYSWPINPDGTLGVWVEDADFPVPINNHDVFATSSRLYVTSGGGNAGVTHSLYVTPFIGGLNDYSFYYGGGIVLLDNTDNFRLPTLTPEEPNTYAYIKF